MSVLSKGTWVVVADGQKALFYENVASAQEPAFRMVSMKDASHLTTQAATDRPGRRADGGQGQKSAMEHADPQARTQTRFAQDLADTLYHQVRKGAFERLVIVAAPQLMGKLRGTLHKLVKARVVAAVGKTLTNHPGDRLERVLKAELAPT